MENSKVLVIDPDPKNLQILKETLETSGYDVATSGNGEEAWNILQMSKPDIIISEVDTPRLNGFQLLEKLQKDPSLSSVPLVFLTNRRNLEDRIKSLQTGVKDYMIKPLHVKEVLARVEMILRRIDRLKNEETESSRKTVGRLEEQSVESLLEGYGVEKKSGILSLYDNHNRNGEIYFRDGSVVNARLGNFRAEKAVYQMLPWDRGHFIMTFKNVTVSDEITVSNLGLLLQGHKRLQERNSLLKQLPSLDTTFTKTSIFQKILKRKTVGEDAFNFIELFDGNRTLSEIISESTYDELKALERIIRMYDQGFIARLEQNGDAILPPKPARDFEPEKKPLIPEVEEPKIETSYDTLNLPPASDDSLANGHAETSENQDVEEPPPFEFPQKEESSPLNGSIFKDIHKDNSIKKDVVEDKKNEPFKNGLDLSSEDTSIAPVENKPEDVDKSQETLNDIWKSSSKVNFEELDSVPKFSPEPTVENEQTQPAATQMSVQSTAIDSGMQELCERLFNAHDGGKGKIVVVCGNNKCRAEFISTFTNGKFIQKNIGGKKDLLEIGKVTTSQQKELEIVGISPERKFLQVLEEAKSSLLAYIILIVGDTSNSLSYLGYLVKSLEAKFKVPHVMAVHRPSDKKKIPLDFIRYSLKLDDDDQIVDVCINDVGSIKHLLKQLIPPQNYAPVKMHKPVDDYSLKT